MDGEELQAEAARSRREIEGAADDVDRAAGDVRDAGGELAETVNRASASLRNFAQEVMEAARKHARGEE